MMAGFWSNLKDRIRDWIVLKPPTGPSSFGKFPSVVRSKIGNLIPTRPTVVSQETPNTLTAFSSDESVHRAKLFDPSLKHCLSAFRQGEPSFADSEMARRWLETRRTVMDAVLRFVANSGYRDHLILRGSVLMKSWFPETAREPGDIDWLVTPSTISIRDGFANELFRDMVVGLGELRTVGSARLISVGIKTDDIWSYERAPGKRIVIPWVANDLPYGSVQMDFVFGERVPLPPEPHTFHHVDGSTSQLQIASMTMSLVWKMIWLLTDSYPQGKDLYDAVLLAEAVPLPWNLLCEEIKRVDDYWSRVELTLDWVEHLKPDWDSFLAEYPSVTGSSLEWVARLYDAVFAAYSSDPENCPNEPDGGDASTKNGPSS